MNSLKNRLRGKFNVSVTEIDKLDNRSVGVLGVTCASNGKQHVHQTFSKIISFFERDKRIVVLDMETEVLA